MCISQSVVCGPGPLQVVFSFRTEHVTCVLCARPSALQSLEPITHTFSNLLGTYYVPDTADNMVGQINMSVPLRSLGCAENQT